MSDETTPQDSAAMSPASDGSVAWGVVNARGEVEGIHWKWQEAVGMALIEGKVVPLYRSPSLTDAEREAVDRQAKWLVNQAKHKPDIHSADLLLQEAATLRGLLERLGGGDAE